MSKQRLLTPFYMSILLLINLTVLCQEIVPVQTNEKLVIKSKALNEERTILVRVPANYAQSPDKYPVVYMLDGQFPRITLMTGNIQNLASAGLMPEMIVVSIPNTDRGRDMTPSSVANQSSGGADNFLKFLGTELIPVIDKTYRVQPYRAIVGHSLSGLFVMYAFASQPELFNAYLAASPHLQWDNHFILKRAGELLATKKDLNRTLFIALGDEPDYLQGFNGYRDILKRLQIKNLDYEFRQFPEENHQSINTPVFHYGLCKVWSSLNFERFNNLSSPPPTLPEIESHYKNAAIKYGYEIPIPENFLNYTGYRLLEINNMAAALQVFEKNIKLYPASANTYDSFAEALEKDGQLQKAKENYEKGVQLAEKGDNHELTNIIKENLKRVSAKLQPQK